MCCSDWVSPIAVHFVSFIFYYYCPINCNLHPPPLSFFQPLFSLLPSPVSLLPSLFSLLPSPFSLLPLHSSLRMLLPPPSSLYFFLMPQTVFLCELKEFSLYNLKISILLNMLRREGRGCSKGIREGLIVNL